MVALILETSSEKSLILLSNAGGPIAVRPLEGGPALSKNLALEVQSLCTPFQPEIIAVGQGPGSYTGIRVGVALAKALGFGWQIPVVGFCSLRAFSPPVTSPFAVLVDAKMGGLYAIKKGDRPCLIPLSEARESLADISHFASPHPALIQKRIALEGQWFETAPDPVLLAKLVFQEKLSSPELSYLN